MPETPSPRPAREVPMPAAIELSRDGPNLVIELRWFRLIHLLMIPFIICVDVIALLGGPSLMPFWIVAIWLTYSTAAGFLNRTRVTAGSGEVDVRIGPLPWPGSMRIDASEITQVFAEDIHRVTRTAPSGVQYSYSVQAFTPQGSRLTILSGLTDRDVALYLEQEIEKALGITDRKVPSELEK